MERIELARSIRRAARLTGRFVLRSGQVSDVYWDKYRFESTPVLLRAIARGLLDLVRGLVFDRLVGLELGGIPLATAMSLESGLPCGFVRKQPKPYGTRNLVEGGAAPGERLLVVEDVITTAGQVVDSVQQLRRSGFTVEHIVCVIDREAGGAERLEREGCKLRALFTMSELEQVG